MNPNSGHGHVFPRPDGIRMRCGGPSLCMSCRRDAGLKATGGTVSHEGGGESNIKDTPPVPGMILGFKMFYHARIIMQVVMGGSGRDFAAYIGVLDGDVYHRPYETRASGGGGFPMPHPTKMSYADAKYNFGQLFDELEAKGFQWRD